MEEIIEKDAEDVRSCIIDIPKRRVFAKVSKDLIKMCVNRNPLKRKEEQRIRKPSETSLMKYSLPQANPLRVRKGGNDDIMLSFRQFAKQEQRLKHRQRMAIKSSEEYRIRSTDLRKRLHLESPPDDVLVLTNIDRDFFNFVNGRQPSQDRDKCTFKSVSHFYNYRLQKKIEVGYRMDTIFNIDAIHQKEREEYHLCMERSAKQAKYFDKFISEDYLKSMACLQRWEDVKYEVSLKSMELKSLASDIFTITSRLVGLEYMYALQQKYGRFLYYLSHPSWRIQNREFAKSVEIEAKGFDLGRDLNDEDSFTKIFDKMRRECAGNFVKPVLYFKTPADLLEVFETIEMQQQYQFAHASRMAPLIKVLRIGIMNLTEIMSMDSAAVASSIKGLESQIQFYTERSAQLEKKFFKIIHGLFYDCAGALDVLEFNVHLEFCYEKVFKEKPINLDIRAMAKALECMYFDYQMRLESLGGNNVKKAIKECIAEDKLKIKKAHEAARELRLFNRLKKELQISCAPVIRREGKIIRPTITEANALRSTGRDTALATHNKRKTKQKPAKRSLTDAEVEYLKLFTDWDEVEDPSLYLLSYNTISDQTC
ncbi:hypothetical protein NE865_02565 [Phthorimaea operculella]|nr:hypothetical protein NE865_02565 [Phthorimaea operculella]